MLLFSVGGKPRTPPYLPDVMFDVQYDTGGAPALKLAVALTRWNGGVLEAELGLMDTAVAWSNGYPNGGPEFYVYKKWFPGPDSETPAGIPAEYNSITFAHGLGEYSGIGPQRAYIRRLDLRSEAGGLQQRDVPFGTRGYNWLGGNPGGAVTVPFPGLAYYNANTATIKEIAKLDGTPGNLEALYRELASATVTPRAGLEPAVRIVGGRGNYTVTPNADGGLTVEHLGIGNLTNHRFIYSSSGAILSARYWFGSNESGGGPLNDPVRIGQVRSLALVYYDYCLSQVTAFPNSTPGPVAPNGSGHVKWYADNHPSRFAVAAQSLPLAPWRVLVVPLPGRTIP